MNAGFQEVSRCPRYYSIVPGPPKIPLAELTVAVRRLAAVELKEFKEAKQSSHQPRVASLKIYTGTEKNNVKGIFHIISQDFRGLTGVFRITVGSNPRQPSMSSPV
jgi:hypothetical protein